MNAIAVVIHILRIFHAYQTSHMSFWCSVMMVTKVLDDVSKEIMPSPKVGARSFLSPLGDLEMDLSGDIPIPIPIPTFRFECSKLL